MSMDKRSIREFCELDMPIFMFDKNGDFMVARLGEVCAIFLLLHPSSHTLSLGILSVTRKFDLIWMKGSLF